ncbi:MAG: hypothetical protein ABI120_21345 [Gemmatimonadaceae bacterium]
MISRSRILTASVVVLFTLVGSAHQLFAQSFRVIVNNAVTADDVTASALAKVFLKQTNKLPDGTSVTAVYQSKTSPARAAFDKEILRKTVAGVETFWQLQIFSGKDVPPAVKNSDEDVVTFVKATPGGIGYVSTGASVAGVKVIIVR